jgi:hypothetical protein
VGTAANLTPTSLAALSTLDAEQAEPADSRTRPNRSSLALRLLAHLIVWTPFVIGTVGSVLGGWQPAGDGGAITIRSWAELTSKGTLIGQATSTRGVFELGPLEYWLLAIPSHLNSHVGSLVGAELFCVVAVSLAVEALYCAFGSSGALLGAAGIAANFIWMPVIAESPVWNPHFGQVWFLATICCGLAVLAGRIVWLPALVVSGSVAMQAHVMYTLPAALIVVAGIGVAVYAVLRTRTGLPWLIAGAVVGLACWIAPIYQQLTSTSGNMTALLDSQQGRTMGLDYGLRAIAETTSRHTFWLQSVTTKRLLDVTLIQHNSPTRGTEVLILSALLFPLALVLRSRALGAMAAVNLSLLVGICFEFDKTPRHGLLATYYLVEPLFPAGLFCWLSLVTALVLTVRFASARFANRMTATEHAKDRDLELVWAGLAAVVALGAVTWTATQEAPAFDNPVAVGHLSPVTDLCSQIKAHVPHGPVRLTVLATRGATAELLVFGVGACLQANGYNPEPTNLGYAAELGPSFGPQPGATSVIINRKANPPSLEVVPGHSPTRS